MEEEVLGKAYDARLMRRLLTYIRPYKSEILVALVLLLFNAVLQAVGPLLTEFAVDRYLVPSSQHPAPAFARYLANDAWTGLAEVSLLYLAALIGAFLCDFGEQYLMQAIGQKAMFDLRRQLMAHLQRLDLAYYDRNPVGRLVTRLTTDVDALNELFSSGLLMILGDVLMLSIVVGVMLKLSPGMTGVLLAVMPLVVLVTVRFRRSVQQSYRRIRVAIARINSYLQEHVNGIAVLQLFNREDRSRAEFERINRDHMEAFKDAITAYGWFYPWVEFLGMLALALLLAYGGFRIRSGALTLGVLVAFFQYGLRFFRPIQDLSDKYNILQSAMAASERVFKLLDTPVGIQSPAQPKPLPRGPAAIEFDHVWFAYKDEDWVLSDVSFRIEPGETIAVVGHTGAGKTTLTSLLLRFYEVQRGHIRIGGTDIREFDLEELRRNFGVVLQDPHLFTGTVASNIRLGTSGISDQQMDEAAEQVNLLDFIHTLPERFAQPVRERGNGYSTGQKQLISFARALAHNPRFLILDEATSSVDTETEFRIRDALARLVEGRTSIVIAHRLSTIQR
ncbi:MAG TPA: ABC transporter ATP-binding protein, partial [Bryobacteraceae bacterium]|nr:ABC transporter ATP-binding protein [Bryobacteraceae bacterium]